MTCSFTPNHDLFVSIFIFLVEATYFAGFICCKCTNNFIHEEKRRVQDSFKISPHFRSKKIASEDLLCVHSGLLHSHCEAALCRGFVERTLQGFDFMTEKKIFFFFLGFF